MKRGLKLISSVLFSSAILTGSVLQGSEAKAQDCINYWIPPRQTQPVCFQGTISYQTGSDRVFVTTFPDGSNAYLLKNTIIRYARGEGKFTLDMSGAIDTYQIDCNKNVVQAIGGRYRNVTMGAGTPFQFRVDGGFKKVVCPYLR